MGRPFIDLTGKTLNNGLYIKCVDSASGGAGKHKKWICVCPICHNEFKTQSNHILQDKIESCSTCSRLKFNDLSGQTFGKLYVISRTEEIGHGSKYNCQCECGNKCIVDGRCLKSGNVKSCGCLISSMEHKMRSILIKYNITFQTQKTFDDCADVRVLPFDFYIPELNMLVELQGGQHFKPVKYFGGEDSFIKQIAHDLIKEDYCERNNYKLLQIAYYENLEDRINEEIVWPLRKQKD